MIIIPPSLRYSKRKHSIAYSALPCDKIRHLTDYTTKRVRSSNSPRITPQLKKRLHERDIFKFMKSDWFGKCWWLALIQEIRNSTNSEVKFAKKVYFDNAFKENQGDLRNTQRIINELTSRKSKSSFVKEIKLNNGNSIHDPLELSNSFNDHFCNISPTLANEIHVDENGPSHVDYLCETWECRFELKTSTCKQGMN